MARCQSRGERFGNDQGALIGADDHAVRAPQFLCGEGIGAVGIDAVHPPGARCVALGGAETDDADEGPAVLVDDHVVELVVAGLGKVGVHGDRTVGGAPQ